MHPLLTETRKVAPKGNVVFLAGKPGDLPDGFFTSAELKHLSEERKKEKKALFLFNRLDRWLFVRFPEEEKDEFRQLENFRKGGASFGKNLGEQKIREITICDATGNPGQALAFAEGLALGSYRFLKYKTKKENESGLEKINILATSLPAVEIERLSVVIEAVFRCRTLINEPNSYLTAEVFAKEITAMAKECGVKTEVLNKKRIEALQMGGLLAVNKGSQEPPTFTVMEWAPPKAVNKKPYVFIGKGIVFDSGGMNLKPGDSMSTMKDDMSGAAAVAAAVCAIARAKLPVRVIGLMPATDNRPGPEAIVPGDIIRMHDQTTVEVLNTDAEGRLILADALSYAKKYDPGLVIDLATLTGSAVRAVGKFGIVAMQSDAEKELESLKKAGLKVYERLVELPSWEEYGEMIKSDLADLKNVGPPEAGAITAGKFLQKFAAYPYIHLDIAGPAFLESADSYRGKGGTGVGVRLLFEFIRTVAEKR
jgi:leucyl aminopeptidase